MRENGGEARPGVADPPKGSGAIGSAPVSKTGGCGFESLLPCEHHRVPGLPAASAEGEHTEAGQPEVSQTTKATAEPAEAKKRTGLLLFLRQVVEELRKVVWPSRRDLLSYTGVVLVFVVVMMLFVSLLDYGIGKLILLVFGS